MIGLAGVLLGVAALATSPVPAPVPTTTTTTPPPSAITVRGETTCPRPPEVSSALVGLLAASASAGAPDVVDLAAHGAGHSGGPGASVTVKLSTAAGEVIAEKILPNTLSCAERARTAAVIVAAWEARLRAVAGPLGPIPAVTPPPIGGPSSGANAGGQQQQPPPSPAGASAPRSAGDPGAPSATRASAPLEVETSAAILASLAAGGVAPSLMVAVAFMRRESRFALAVGALAVGTHTTAVGPGRGSWRRVGGVVDLQSSSRWRTVEVQMHAGLALTALAIAGEALPVTEGAEIFDPGLLVGVRLRFRLGRLSPWLEATAASWLRAHTLYVNGSSATSQLPSYEGLLGAGFSLGQDH